MAWGGKSGAASGAPAKNGGALSFIGSEVTISGNISGKGDLHLDGTVEGDIHCASLILGAGGRIKGNITAEKATLGILPQQPLFPESDHGTFVEALEASCRTRRLTNPVGLSVVDLPTCYLS